MSQQILNVCVSELNTHFLSNSDRSGTEWSYSKYMSPARVSKPARSSRPTECADYNKLAPGVETMASGKDGNAWKATGEGCMAWVLFYMRQWEEDSLLRLNNWNVEESKGADHKYVSKASLSNRGSTQTQRHNTVHQNSPGKKYYTFRSHFCT